MGGGGGGGGGSVEVGVGGVGRGSLSHPCKAVREARRGPERRPDRAKSPGHGCAARGPAPAPKLSGSGCDGAGSEPRDGGGSSSIRRGTGPITGGFYRSDRLPYARAGIPALYFTSALHPHYHTERGDPAAIDVGKFARMARWMCATGRTVVELVEGTRVDPELQLERRGVGDGVPNLASRWEATEYWRRPSVPSTIGKPSRPTTRCAGR